ncbi:MAG: zf-HC2 domain-containing protein [Armatimonadota bacterium]|nr:zf-HC2 domain-containing protein [Armatimonadota bacterium]
MSLSCREALERATELATGSMPPDARAPVLAHLAACAACRDEVAALEATAALLRRHAPAAPPGFWPAFMRQLDRRLARERLPAGVRLRRWLAVPRRAWVATALAVATAAGLWLAVHPGSPPADPDLARARVLVTEAMTTTLPALNETLDLWRVGLTEPDVVFTRSGR